MNTEQNPNTNTASDELDLGQFFQLISHFFNSVLRFILRVFVYLKRNFVKLLILAVSGLVAGYGINQITTKQLKTDVIVKPNWESKDYLYDIINEIQSNIAARNEEFFKDLDINVEDLKGFSVTIEPIEIKVERDQNLEYLELLEKFQSTNFVEDILRNEIQDKSPLTHRITFYYKYADSGSENARKLVEYINTNSYFTEISKISQKNHTQRIELNQKLLNQLDELTDRYSENLAKKDSPVTEARILFGSEERSNIADLFNLKNRLIRDTEEKRVLLEQEKEVIRIVYFGQTQQVQKAIFGRTLVLIPTLLIGIFVLFDIFKYMDRKAKELNI